MRPLALGLMLLAGAFGPVLALHGCTPATARATYESQLAACVDRAATKAQAEECRARIDAAWGQQADAGDAGGDR